MDVSVIIITKNQLNYLKKTIPAIKKQDYEGSYEILVVDSGSTDGAREYCIKQKVKVINYSPKTFNYAAAFNKGASHANGRYLVRLSGDCMPITNSWLTELIRPFSDPKVGGTFGRYVVTNRPGYGYPESWPESRFPSKKKRFTIKPFFFMGAGFSYLTIGKEIFEFAGDNCAIRQNIWKNRKFNENLPRSEDAEYSWVLHVLGYDIVYTPFAKTLHEHQTQPSSSKIKSALSKNVFIFNANIWKYWLLRLVSRDPLKNLYFTPKS